MVCRRGEIRGQEVGAIRVERTFSIVEVAAPVAESFAEAAARPDPRDPRLLIERDRFEPRSRQTPSQASETVHPARPVAPNFDKKSKGKGEFLKRLKAGQGFPFESNSKGTFRKKEKGKKKSKKQKTVTVHGSDKPTTKSPVKPGTPGGPTRIVLPVHDESDRGRKPRFTPMSWRSSL
jgi:hypothetical protein